MATSPESITGDQEDRLSPYAEQPADDSLEKSAATLSDERHASKLHGRIQNTKKLLQVAAVGAEAVPFAQEALRYGPIFLGTLAATGSPEAAGAALAGSTLLIEGAGALAAAELLNSRQSTRMLNWANRQVQRIIPEGAQVPPYAEVPVAMTLGTPALMLAKNAADPSRTLEQNRRHGLFTATWVATVLGAEGAIFGKSIEHYNDPKLWAASAVAIGGLGAVVKAFKKLAKKNLEEQTSVRSETPRQDGETGPQPEPAKQAAKAYEAYRDAHDEAVKIGLYGEDLESAFRNPDTVFTDFTMENGERLPMPLLVPIESLEWYNIDVLRRHYGENHQFYYFAHPPLPADPEAVKTIQTSIKEKVDQGAIIITDQYLSGGDDQSILELGDGYPLETMGEKDSPKKNDVFAGRTSFEGADSVKQARPLYEVYRQAVASGEIRFNPETGVAMVDVFDEAAAEKIWEMYEAPFAELGADDPSPAGYDKETLLQLLKDPAVAKVVYREEGQVLSLCFFVQDFDLCPWFNKEFYQREYPEYYQTGNVVIFPGIVSDMRKRGASYSGQVIDLAMNLYSKRGSKALMTFECTEVSTRYIPRIVERAVNNSGVGTVAGLDRPISTTIYKVLRRSGQPVAESTS